MSTITGGHSTNTTNGMRMAYMENCLQEIFRRVGSIKTNEVILRIIINGEERYERFASLSIDDPTKTAEDFRRIHSTRDVDYHTLVKDNYEGFYNVLHDIYMKNQSGIIQISYDLTKEKKVEVVAEVSPVSGIRNIHRRDDYIEEQSKLGYFIMDFYITPSKQINER